MTDDERDAAGAMADPGHDFPPDGYEPFRASGHVVADLGDGPFALFVGFDDVRAAARDWQRFTSDTPFEVPIPHEHGVRPVRQLPIETDPPDHTDYRSLTARFFSHSAAESHRDAIEAVVDLAVERALEAGHVLDVVSDLALPVVNHGLAATLGRPAHEADHWLTWGIHVFERGDDGKSANDELNDFLERTVDAAVADPGADFFGALATARFRGRPLSRDEMIGFGNLVFAGGRDTVAQAIATASWYFSTHPDDWRRLRDQPELVRSAVEELLRLSTPLPFIGRHATAACEHAGARIEEGDLVALGFAAANRDPTAFDHADQCVIDRWPNRHIAFGHGPHTCSGAHLARMEIRVVLERLLARVEQLGLADEVRYAHLTIDGRRIPYGLRDVRVRLHAG